ncbi:hypothetical protein, partial [Mycobacterium sp.]|uniref:hypothetical protein n=1 Tax=Mycobacterium sp. TaxID=1785 RepID=UPI003A8A6483
RLAVVDVRDDAEVPNLRRRREGLVGETADWVLLVERPTNTLSVSVRNRPDTITRLCCLHGTG